MKVLNFGSNIIYLRFVFICTEGKLFLPSVIMVLDFSTGDLSFGLLCVYFPSEPINYNYIVLTLILLVVKW
jgi:hypothetical protein